MSNKPIHSIFHYRVEIADSKGLLGPKNEFVVEELEVIGENDRYMVLNDRTFTTIDKKGDKYSIGVPLDREVIGLSANDSTWGNRISYSLHTFKKKTAASIRKAIEKEVIKRFGFFIGGLDLDVIKDPAKGRTA